MKERLEKTGRKEKGFTGIIHKGNNNNITEGSCCGRSRGKHISPALHSTAFHKRKWAFEIMIPGVVLPGAETFKVADIRT